MVLCAIYTVRVVGKRVTWSGGWEVTTWWEVGGERWVFGGGRWELVGGR